MAFASARPEPPSGYSYNRPSGGNGGGHSSGGHSSGGFSSGGSSSSFGQSGFGGGVFIIVIVDQISNGL